MPRLSSLIHSVIPLACTLFTLLLDVLRLLGLCLRPSPALAAENLFLRKQLALYQEHPRHDASRTRRVSGWCCPVLVEQGSPSHAGARREAVRPLPTDAAIDTVASMHAFSTTTALCALAL
jgi:hypothetical protein